MFHLAPAGLHTPVLVLRLPHIVRRGRGRRRRGEGKASHIVARKAGRANHVWQWPATVPVSVWQRAAPIMYVCMYVCICIMYT